MRVKCPKHLHTHTHTHTFTLIHAHAHTNTDTFALTHAYAHTHAHSFVKLLKQYKKNTITKNSRYHAIQLPIIVVDVLGIHT